LIWGQEPELIILTMNGEQRTRKLIQGCSWHCAPAQVSFRTPRGHHCPRRNKLTIFISYSTGSINNVGDSLCVLDAELVGDEGTFHNRAFSTRSNPGGICPSAR